MKYKNANALRFGSDQPRDAGPLLSQNEAGRQKSWLQAANFYAVKPKQITKIVNMFSKLRQGQELFTKPCATCSPTPTFFNFQGHFVTMVSQHCCDIIIDDINATQSSTHNSQEKTRDRNKLASLLVLTKGRCCKKNQCSMPQLSTHILPDPCFQFSQQANRESKADMESWDEAGHEEQRLHKNART